MTRRAWLSSAGSTRSVSRPRFTRRISSTISPGSSRGRGLRKIRRTSVCLSAAAARLPAEGQRDFLLTLAHAATVGGRFDAAASAASEVLRRAAPGSVEEARGRLYLDAGRIFSDGAYDTALTDLRQISVAKLDRSDVALRAAALGVAAQLRVTPDAAAVLSQAPADGGAGKDGEPSTIRSAEEALRRTESLVATGGPAP